MLTLLVGGGVSSAPADTLKPEHIEFFEKKVRPILVQHCYRCHSTQAKKIKGELKLDSLANALKGGESGPALVPGQPDKSRLIRAIIYKDVDLQMPPTGKLPDAVIADLTAWIKMGAPWPGANDTHKAAVASTAGFDLQKRKREHWAWRPIRLPGTPAVKDMAWPSTTADRFILSRLEEKRLKPAPAADRRTLIRRVYFDLIGLPPTPKEVDAFLSDRLPTALAKVVDRLLASPRFGERWGRHWLDLVRYAESRGHEFDYSSPNAYQYRDYVVRAFNADVPYDRFVTEHLAGDLLANPRIHPTAGFNESLLGTGFWFLGEELHSPVDICQDQADRFDNMIDVMGKTFLGLTIACARCHDHKFDAISTKDYYGLFGFLKSSTYRLAPFDSLDANRRIAAELKKLRDASRPRVAHALGQAMRPEIDRLAGYLLAARDLIRTRDDLQRNGTQARSLSLKIEDKRREIAQKNGVDEALLSRWVDHLGVAFKDRADPFHLWAKVAFDPAGENAKRLSDLTRALVEAWRKQSAEATASMKGAEVIVDYAALKPASWLTNGAAFGTAPVRPGDVRFSDDPARPIAKLFDYAAAEKDSTWNGLKPAAGSENDPGALGAAVRSGRTVMTPTFKITTGKVFYLVKGTGLAYASVDSHIMIAGPLHGQLVRSIDVPDGFRWVGHDLTRYQGLDAHMEFTATSSADFAVALVVQAETPPHAVNRPNELLLKMLERTEARTLKTLAEDYQRLMADVVSHLAEDQIIGSDEAASYSKLASWLIQHFDLVTTSREAVAKHVGPAARSFLAAQAKLTARIKTESRLALAMLDGTGVDEHVYIRGTHKAPGPRVGRRFLEALAGPQPLKIIQGSGRLELARQMTDPALNPFLPRVMVNRLWHHLFGRGIVASVDNFGLLGEAPTHPELLDFLASRFVEQGWSVKKMIREMVLSSAYQMSSRTAPEGERGATPAQADDADPQNLLLHRMRIRRLEGEAIRDAMLTISRRLESRMYGPAVPVFLTPFLEGRGRPASGPLDGDGRRSLYLAIRRNFLSPILTAFDTPIPFSTVGKRTVSNVPAQALILMNDPFVHQQARRWAERVLANPTPASQRITGMYLSAFGRLPSEAELAACLTFLRQQNKTTGGHHTPVDDPKVWADLAHVLINAKEFIYIQ